MLILGRFVVFINFKNERIELDKSEKERQVIITQQILWSVREI